MGTPVSTTVVKTFAILGLFAKRTSVTTTYVTEELGFPHSTAYRLLTGLVSVGVLDQPAKNRYTLSLQLFELGALAPTRRRLCDRARLPLERLTRDSGLPTNMGALDGGHLVLLETLPGRLHSVPTRVGHRAPIHATSLGKLLVAYADESVRELLFSAPLHAFTRQTITSRSALEDQFARIRASGCADEIEETHLGTACLAVPVRVNGICLAGISISSPASTFARKRETYRRSLMKVAQEIERGVAWQATLSWPSDDQRDAS